MYINTYKYLYIHNINIYIYICMYEYVYAYTHVAPRSKLGERWAVSARSSLLDGISKYLCVCVREKGNARGNEIKWWCTRDGEIGLAGWWNLGFINIVYESIASMESQNVCVCVCAFVCVFERDSECMRGTKLRKCVCARETERKCVS